MEEYDPGSLPDVTALEIVDLRRIDANRAGEYMNDAADAPAIKCDGHLAKDIANIWRALPAGDSIRCHTPVVGIRFFDGASLICEASVCFQCENIFGYFQRAPIIYRFNPRSNQGRELFLLLKGIVGAEVMGDEFS